MKDISSYIEHTLLKPTATVDGIVLLCKQAIDYNFYGVCVNSCYVYLVADQLKDQSQKVIATVGFPLGTASTDAKIEEAKQAVKDGANEIDMVMNLGFLKSQLTKSVTEEIRAIKEAIGNNTLKVIIETGHLSNADIALASEIVRIAGADFIKTSTGFGPRGASLQDIFIIKKTVGSQLQIKASGGIKTKQQVDEFIVAGANRIGTSNSINIVLDSKK